jgi:peptide/nickel transport system permease protein
VEQAAFGLPAPQGGAAFQTLPGDYAFLVRVTATDPRDSVGAFKVVVGGDSFGVMGTDSLGRDLAVGLLFGFPVALFIGLMASTLTTTIGASLGIVSGYMGGWVDVVIQRMADIAANIPLLPILIFMVFIFGSNLFLIILLLVVFSWPGLTIVVRSMVLQLRSGQFVEASLALGASRRRIMLRHIFPQVAPFVLAQMIFFTPAAILAEAGLSFLGLGDPSIPTWGQILEQGFRTGAVYVGYWWWVLPPGLLIILTSVTFALLALALEPVINPRLRGRN